MGKGGSARESLVATNLFSSVPVDAPKRMQLAPLDWASLHGDVKPVVLMSLWFVFSVASLFVAKHVLHQHGMNEAVFSLWQFALSVMFGLQLTKVAKLHELASLTRPQLRAIVPLSVTFLIKEVLKYAALSRVSVNLVNTIRSLGPLFNVLLEFLFLAHRPQSSLVWALVPIITGVALTSIDEMHVASLSNSLVVTVAGFLAAILSTAINNAQNIYSKMLFGRERIDAVSLQIYLSGISLVLMSPLTISQVVYKSFSDGGVDAGFLVPSGAALGAVVVAGFVNFVASQLAFNTLRLVTPLSYSVANTFKRVAIAVLAIFYFNERLSVVNGVGIAISIAGIFIYERQARSVREARQYRIVPDRDSALIQGTPVKQIGQQHDAGNGMLSAALKKNASGPDLVGMDMRGCDATPVKGEGHGGDVLQRHLYIDVPMASPNLVVRTGAEVTPLRV